MMTLIDEYTRKCLDIRVARQLTSADVLSVLSEAIEEEGAPSYIRSDKRQCSEERSDDMRSHSLLIKCSSGCQTKTSRRSISIRPVPGKTFSSSRFTTAYAMSVRTVKCCSA